VGKRGSGVGGEGPGKACKAHSVWCLCVLCNDHGGGICYMYVCVCVCMYVYVCVCM